MGMRDLTVWHVTREYAGIAEVGGVKDAVRGLAMALSRKGIPTVVVLPLYGFLRDRFIHAEQISDFTLDVADHEAGNRIRREPVRVLMIREEELRIFLVQSARFDNKRSVYTYAAEDEAQDPHKRKGTGHWDSHEMNFVLQCAALEASLRVGERPAIFHCHDGHAAFLPVMMREIPRYSRAFRETAALVTIHNAGVGYHQEIWDLQFARLLTGLKESILRKGLINGTVDPLLLASSYATLSTVSERYAEELLEDDGELSAGLGKTLRGRGIRIAGITNGIDPIPFDPRDAAAAGIPFPFDPSLGDWEGKKKCRKTLCEILGGGFPADGPALFSFIGRLTPQKGIDVLIGALSDLLREPGCPCFLVLGQGDGAMEKQLNEISACREGCGRLIFIPRYDPPTAKLIYASSDFLLVPSTYEPCGLTDFNAQLMGTIPLVHHVGGLVKVRDGETGFSYITQSVEGLAEAVRRCERLFHEEPALLERIRRKAFAEIFARHTWDIVALEGYVPLYDSAISALATEAPWKGR
jgi:starch synthase